MSMIKAVKVWVSPPPISVLTTHTALKNKIFVGSY